MSNKSDRLLPVFGSQLQNVDGCLVDYFGQAESNHHSPIAGSKQLVYWETLHTGGTSVTMCERHTYVYIVHVDQSNIVQN